jgi:hypothetical protein
MKLPPVLPVYRGERRPRRYLLQVRDWTQLDSHKRACRECGRTTAWVECGLDVCPDRPWCDDCAPVDCMRLQFVDCERSAHEYNLELSARIASMASGGTLPASRLNLQDGAR